MIISDYGYAYDYYYSFVIFMIKVFSITLNTRWVMNLLILRVVVIVGLIMIMII